MLKLLVGLVCISWFSLANAQNTELTTSTQYDFVRDGSIEDQQLTISATKNIAGVGMLSIKVKNPLEVVSLNFSANDLTNLVEIIDASVLAATDNIEPKKLDARTTYRTGGAVSWTLEAVKDSLLEGAINTVVQYNESVSEQTIMISLADNSNSVEYIIPGKTLIQLHYTDFQQAIAFLLEDIVPTDYTSMTEYK